MKAAEYQKVLELFDQNIIKPDFFPDAIWTCSMDDGNLFWNTDADLDNLENRSGNTYSLDYIIDYDSFAGYTIFTGKDDFGDKYQIIFRDINRHG
jgi:hypothetical protein